MFLCIKSNAPPPVRAAIALIQASFLVAFICCSFQQSAAAQSKTRVGLITSVTGYAAVMGYEAKIAVELALLKQESIEVVVRDDGSDPERAAPEYRRLINDDKVDIIIGPMLSSTAVAVMRAMGDDPTPVILLNALPTTEGKRPRNVFRIGTTEGHLRLFASTFIQRELKRSQVTFIGSSAGLAGGAHIKEAFPGMLATQITQFGQTKLTGDQSVAYLNDYSNMTIGDVKKLSSDTAIPIVVSRASGFGELRQLQSPQTYVVTIGVDNTPQLRTFRERFSKKNSNNGPLFNVAERAYAAAEVVIQVSQGARPAGRKVVRTDLEGRTFSTVFGPLTLRPGEGCSALPLAIYRLDAKRTLASATDGNECSCTDLGCCSSCPCSSSACGTSATCKP